MIEEIKKEIEDAMWDDGIAMSMDELFKILDKYKNQEEFNFKKITKDEIEDYLDTDYVLLNLNTYSELTGLTKELIAYKKAWKELIEELYKKDQEISAVDRVR